MNKQRFAITAGLAVFFAAAAFGLVVGAHVALSQEDMKEIRAAAFCKGHTRPPAAFEHDRHNEKAGIEECETCHHGKDDKGRRDPADMSAGTPCADCHAVESNSGTPLMRAYHRQCIFCHTERKAGPTYCGGCHKTDA